MTYIKIYFDQIWLFAKERGKFVCLKTGIWTLLTRCFFKMSGQMMVPCRSCSWWRAKKQTTYSQIISWWLLLHCLTSYCVAACVPLNSTLHGGLTEAVMPDDMPTPCHLLTPLAHKTSDLAMLQSAALVQIYQ